MQNNIFIQLSLCATLLSFPTLSYSAVAYIPQSLKSCLNIVKNSAHSSNNHNLEDVYSIINENRILASESTMNKAVKEALRIVEENDTTFETPAQKKAVTKYLKGYLASLKEDKQVVLNIRGENVTSWPSSLVMRSMENNSTQFDLMQLSNELVSSETITLCGNMNVYNSKDFANVVTRDPNVPFNANMMTNVESASPTIVFGTGVTSPVINAWVMSASNLTQSPINIEFAIPQDLKTKKPVSLDLHFLVKRQPAPTGKARVQVQAKYVHPDTSFNIDTFEFSDINNSPNFTVSEPNVTNTLKYITVSVPLDKTTIKNGDLALFSISRIAPSSGAEYSGDIYLAAATFEYTSK